VDVRDNPQRLQRVFRKNDLPAFVGLRRSAIDKLVKEGSFPKPIPLNEAGNAVVWLESDLIAWQQRLITGRAAT
jgi:predicted DNA-binding transcriptional regulator AlpA